MQGKTWAEDMKKSIMTTLKPLYENATMKCAEIQFFLQDIRTQVIVDTGFCDILESNSWTLDRTLENHGFPRIMKKIPLKGPLSKLPMEIGGHYYRALDSFKKHIGQAKHVCHEIGKFKNGDFYEVVYSKATKLMMKLLKK